MSIVWKIAATNLGPATWRRSHVSKPFLSLSGHLKCGVKRRALISHSARATVVVRRRPLEPVLRRRADWDRRAPVVRMGRAWARRITGRRAVLLHQAARIAKAARRRTHWVRLPVHHLWADRRRVWDREVRVRTGRRITKARITADRRRRRSRPIDVSISRPPSHC